MDLALVGVLKKIWPPAKFSEVPRAPNKPIAQFLLLYYSILKNEYNILYLYLYYTTILSKSQTWDKMEKFRSSRLRDFHREMMTKWMVYKDLVL